MRVCFYLARICTHASMFLFSEDLHTCSMFLFSDDLHTCEYVFI